MTIYTYLLASPAALYLNLTCDVLILLLWCRLPTWSGAKMPDSSASPHYGIAELVTELIAGLY